MPVDSPVKTLVRLALKEDTGKAGDLATRFFLPRGLRLRGQIVAKQAGVVCGVGIAREVFRQVSPRIRFVPLARDGEHVHAGQTVARVSGSREILTGERTALNFLQRLSGIATLTWKFAAQLKGARARLYDTRKTLPGWRSLDKYAVRCGGGMNHRMGLFDMVMLKDNHLAAAWSGLTPPLPPAGEGRGEGNRGMDSLTLPLSQKEREMREDFKHRIQHFRARNPKVPVLIEAKTSAEVKLAVDCGADIILLDNMPLATLRRAIRQIRASSPRTLIEVSGGVTLGNVRAIGRLGPDRVSVGAITHSAPALDMSLELDA